LTSHQKSQMSSDRSQVNEEGGRQRTSPHMCPTIVQCICSNWLKLCVLTFFSFRLLLKSNAMPSPRRPGNRETCSMLYPSGTRSCKICLSLSWPSQVSVTAMMSTSLDIMKSAIDKRLFATDR